MTRSGHTLGQYAKPLPSHPFRSWNSSVSDEIRSVFPISSRSNSSRWRPTARVSRFTAGRVMDTTISASTAGASCAGCRDCSRSPVRPANMESRAADGINAKARAVASRPCASSPLRGTLSRRPLTLWQSPNPSCHDLSRSRGAGGFQHDPGRSSDAGCNCIARRFSRPARSRGVCARTR